jgi:major inositol transporter-like SP family MFS transporter
VLTTSLGLDLLGYVGRRRMLGIGFSGVVASQAILAVVFTLPQSDVVSYTILAAMMLFVAFVQCFIGTCVWLLLSEIFPMAIRGFAMGIAVFALWTVNAAISFLFPILVVALGSTGTFVVFAVVNLASLVFVSRFVPETKGQSLEELEVHFRTGSLPVIAPATPAGEKAATK